jgi:hypothetical protein
LWFSPSTNPLLWRREEVVGDLVKAALQSSEEAVKAGEPTVLHKTRPGIEIVARLSLGEGSIEDESEDLAQPMGCF